MLRQGLGARASLPALAALVLAPFTGPAPVTIARLHYDGGGDWYANPSSLVNLLAQIRLRTGVPVSSRPVDVRLTDPDLRDYPYLYVTGHGNFRLSDEEVESLRGYLEAGGFILAEIVVVQSFRYQVLGIVPFWQTNQRVEGNEGSNGQSAPDQGTSVTDSE